MPPRELCFNLLLASAFFDCLFVLVLFLLLRVVLFPPGQLFHHHTAAERLLPCQAQLLHVGVHAGGRSPAPHGQFRRGGEGHLCGRRRLLLLLGAGVGGVRVRSLADVQTGLEEIGSRGHGGQGGGVAGRGRGAAGVGRLERPMPGAVLKTGGGLLRRQGGLSGGVEDGGGGKDGGG